MRSECVADEHAKYIRLRSTRAYDAQLVQPSFSPITGSIAVVGLVGMPPPGPVCLSLELSEFQLVLNR